RVPIIRELSPNGTGRARRARASRRQPVIRGAVRPTAHRLALNVPDLAPDLIKGKTEDISDRGDGWEGRGRYPARLDLPQGLRRDTGGQRDVQHRALPPGPAQQGTEASPTFDFGWSERKSNHGTNTITGIPLPV